jgi:pimeloyl-ACP methyl ester carboxylesterase
MDSAQQPVNLYKTPDDYQSVMDFYNRSLASWEIPFQSSFVTTTYGSTHVVACGAKNGKPLVLFHGQNANAASWVKWVHALAADWKLIAVDTIGSFGKSAGVRLKNRSSDYGCWAAEVIRELKLSQANVIGISYGGWLILKLAQVAPELIGSAVLLSSAGFLPIRLSLVLKMVRQSLGSDHKQIIENLAALVSAPGQAPEPFYVEFLEHVLKSGFRPEPFAHKLSGREIRRLTAPTQILMGQFENTYDPVRVLRRAERFLPNLKSAELIPDVGHSLDHEDFQRVLSPVLGFLDRYAVFNPG